MKIQPSSHQGTKISGNVNRNENTHPAEPEDSVQIRKDSGSGDPSLSFITQEGISKLLMKRNKILETPLNQAEKIFRKSQKWKSDRIYGTFSTAVVHCPVGNCYYTGMIGGGDQDKKYGRKYLTAFNPDGSVKWSYDKESITADPAIDSKGNVYVRSQNHLTALDKDGKELWKCEAKGSSGTEDRERLHQNDHRKNCFEDHTPQIGPDGTVYILATGDGIGKEDGGVTAIRDGKELWRSKAYPSASLGPRFIVKNGNIYVSRIDKEERKKALIFKEDVQRDVIACLNPDGSEKFRVNLSEQYSEGITNPEEARQFTVADDGSLYVYDSPRQFTKYSDEGKKLWEHEIEPFSTNQQYDIRLQFPPVPTKDGNIIISALQRRLSYNELTTVIAEMDGNGKVNWHKEFNTHISALPQIAPNGDIYFKTSDDKTGSDDIFHLNGEGRQLEILTAKRRARDVEAIQGYSFAPDGKLSVETLHTECYNHKREIMVVSPYSERVNGYDKEQEAGKIKKTEKFVVIGGVKVPVNEGE